MAEITVPRRFVNVDYVTRADPVDLVQVVKDLR